MPCDGPEGPIEGLRGGPQELRGRCIESDQRWGLAEDTIENRVENYQHGLHGPVFLVEMTTHEVSGSVRVSFYTINVDKSEDE
jgi:hypothetical protein